MPGIEIDPENPDKVVLVGNHLEADLIKLVPGTNYDRKRSRAEAERGIIYTAPLSWGTCVAARGVFPGDLQIGPELTAWAERERQQRIDPCLTIRTMVDVGGPFDERLLPYQRAGVSFLGMAERAVLGDDMGVGKTAQAIMAVDWLDSYGHDVWPVCVITTASTKLNWRNHWKTWVPNARVVVIDGNVTQRRKGFDFVEAAIADGEKVVCIVNYDMLRVHGRLAPFGSMRLKKCRQHGGTEEKIAQCEVHDKELNAFKWRTVIADEVHKMKEPKAKQTRAAWAIMHQPSARYVYGLSGTIGEHPGHLWSILHGVAPADYPTKTAYIDRYCLQAYSPFGDPQIIGVRPEVREEFYAVLNTRYRRMPIDLVLPHLPPKTYIRREAPMGSKQAKAYKEMKDQSFISEDPDGHGLVADSVFAKQIRLQQLAMATAAYDEPTGRVKLTDPSSKLDVLEEVVEELGHRQFVVAAEYRQLIELAVPRLNKMNVSSRLLVGGMTPIEKEANRLDLQEGRSQSLLITMGAGAEGLDMTAAGVLIFVQRSYSLLKNLQTEARVRRIGSEGHAAILIIDIVVPGTVDVPLLATVRRKQARLEQINQDRATILARSGDVSALEAERAAIMAADDLSKELDL